MHLSHFLGYKKLAALLTKTLIFNKVKRNSHDQVLNIINIGYVLLMILRNYILPFWHGAYYIATGLHMSLESTKVSVLFLHSLWITPAGELDFHILTSLTAMSLLCFLPTLEVASDLLFIAVVLFLF